MENQFQQTSNFPQIDRVIKREGNSPDSLIQILHGTQEILGYLPQEAQLYIAEKLQIPPQGYMELYLFTISSPWKKMPNMLFLFVWERLLCKRSRGFNEKLEEVLEVKPNEITPDRKFSFREVRCLGACGMAPVISVDGDVYGRITSDKIPEIIEKYR